MSKIIWLDAGHGGSDPGAVSGSITEKYLNLTFVMKLGARLKELGFDVRYTRTTDVFVGLNARCDLANNAKADLFLSIHADASGNPDTRGHHIIHSIYNDGKLADAIIASMPGIPNSRGSWTRTGTDGKDYYAVIRGTAMQAMIIERGFMTNNSNLLEMLDETYMSKEIDGIVKAVAGYYGVPIPEPKPTIVYFVTGGFAEGSDAEKAFMDFMDSKKWWYRKEVSK